ncbi:MAG: DUF2345 domain-containing protein [Rhodocyclaceae bacterium]
MSDAASQSEADALAQVAKIDAFQQVIHPEDAKKDGTDQPDRDIKGFTAPAILIEAPASIALATPQSVTLFAGEQLSATVQADTQITAQHTVSLVAGAAASLYTHAGGIKAIAANAPLSIQSHDGSLEVLADQNVTVTSSNDEIHVLANSKIVLQAGQSSITLEGANITFACPGNFTVKGANNVMASGGSAAASLGSLPSGTIGTVASSLLAAGSELPKKGASHDRYFVIENSASGKPLEFVKYVLTLADGSILKGTTNEAGETGLMRGAGPLAVTIEVFV